MWMVPSVCDSHYCVIFSPKYMNVFILLFFFMISLAWYWKPLQSCLVSTSQDFFSFSPNPSCCMLSHVQLFVNPWTTIHQAPLSMRFPRQEYWSGLPFPTPGDLSIPGIKPVTPESSLWVGGFFTTAPPGKPPDPSSLAKQSKIERFTHPGLCKEAPQEARKAGFGLRKHSFMFQTYHFQTGDLAQNS